MERAGFQPLQQNNLEEPINRTNSKGSLNSRAVSELALKPKPHLDGIDGESQVSIDSEDYLFSANHADVVKAAVVRNKLQSHSAFCRSCVGCVVFLNTMVIAAEAMFMGSYHMIFDTLELLFTIFYVAEVGFRLWEVGCHDFLTQVDWGWNLFDLAITSFSVLDTLEGLFGSGGGVGASVGRLFRIFRILRMFRAMRFMSEMDYVLTTAAKATMKLGVIVALFIFVFGIIATNMLWDFEDAEVAAKFANLAASMWALFKLMTLDDWVPVAEQIITAKPGMVVFFISFIFSTSIALLSLVPAIFIEISLSSKEKLQKCQEEKTKHVLKRQKMQLLRTMFRMMDTDNSGSISLGEMKKLLSDEESLRALQESGLTKNGELRDVRLGLFDLWEEHVEEAGHNDAELLEEEFIFGLISRAGQEVNQKDVWRSTTTTRLMLADLTSHVNEELDHIRTSQEDMARRQHKIEAHTDFTPVLEMIRDLMDAYTNELSCELSQLARGHGSAGKTDEKSQLIGATSTLAPELEQMRAASKASSAPELGPMRAASKESSGAVSAVCSRLGLTRQLSSMLTTGRSSSNCDHLMNAGNFGNDHLHQTQRVEQPEKSRLDLYDPSGVKRAGSRLFRRGSSKTSLKSGPDSICSDRENSVQEPSTSITTRRMDTICSDRESSFQEPSTSIVTRRTDNEVTRSHDDSLSRNPCSPCIPQPTRARLSL